MSGQESGGTAQGGSCAGKGIQLDSPASSAGSEVSARRRWLKRGIYLVMLAAAVGFIARLHHFAAPDRIQLNDLAFEGLDGAPLPEHSLEGKAVVLNFWAPWCPPCRAEMPWLNHLQASEPGLVVLGVEDDPDEYENGLRFAHSKGIAYPVVESSPLLHKRLPPIHVLPTTLFISRSGRVIHAVTGAIPEIVMRRFAHDAEQTP